MFERFTDGARRVVVLAQEESRGLDHHLIGTEHLLLGLLHEQGGGQADAERERGDGAEGDAHLQRSNAGEQPLQSMPSTGGSVFDHDVGLSNEARWDCAEPLDTGALFGALPA